MIYFTPERIGKAIWKTIDENRVIFIIGVISFIALLGITIGLNPYHVIGTTIPLITWFLFEKAGVAISLLFCEVFYLMGFYS
mgnify:CR=1 FL=1